MNAYVLVPFPLWFMEHARHHSRGGRTRSERFSDRRGMYKDPDLTSSNSQARFTAWKNVGPFRKPIYPGRVTNADVLRAAREANLCMNCGDSLAKLRKDAIFCDGICRKRFYRAVDSPRTRVNAGDVRDKGTRSPNMRGRKVKLRKRQLKNWCPVCQKYQPQNHPQPCRRGNA